MKRTAANTDEASSSHELIAENGKGAKNPTLIHLFLDYEEEYAQHGSGRTVYPGKLFTSNDS